MAKRGLLAQPYFLFAVFLGIGLGTILMGQRPRFALLWTAMVVLSLAYRIGQPVEVGFSVAAVGRGALLGAVVSVPLLAFLSSQLRVFAERLYATHDAVSLYYQICFIAAPVEEYFFRGILQPRLGSTTTIGMYAAVAVLYFLPHAPLLVVLIMGVGMGVLGMIYGYVYERHGLAASISCHIVSGLVLQVAPSAIATLRILLS